MKKTAKNIVSEFLNNINNVEVNYMIRKLLITGMIEQVNHEMDFDVFSFTSEIEYISDICDTINITIDTVNKVQDIISVDISDCENWLSYFSEDQVIDFIVDYMVLEPDTNQVSDEQMNLYGKDLFNFRARLAELQGQWDVVFDSEGNCISMISCPKSSRAR